MGIPRFFRLISEQFPNVAKQTSFKQGFSLPNRKVDNLYLDANGILHNCAHEIYFPPEAKPRLARRMGPKNSIPPPSSAELELKLFQAIAAYMDQLLKFVKPTNLFYIAIDGPAPVAKMCLVGDSLITLSSGLSKPLEHIKYGEKVLGWNGKGFTATENLGLKKMGCKKVLKITMYDGRTLKCTYDHQILIQKGPDILWREAGHLTKDDLIISGLSAPIDIREDSEREWFLTDDSGDILLSMADEINREKTLIIMRMLGYILSDGYITKTEKRKMIGVSLGTRIDAERFTGDIHKISGRRPSISKITGDKGCTYNIRIPMVLVNLIIKIPGIMTGKRVIQPISLPKFLKDSSCPKAVTREFLAGLFGGDGHSPCLSKCRNHNYTITPVKFSQSIVEQYEDSMRDYMNDIITLLSRFGINNVTMAKPEKHTYINNRMVPKDIETNPRKKYTIKLPMTSQFGECIGFRYAINKSLRLDIATAYWSLCENIKNAKQEVVNRASDLFDNYKPNYKCPHCNYIFSCRSSMVRHISYRCVKNKRTIYLPITDMTMKMALNKSRKEYLDNHVLMHKNILSSLQEVHDIRSRGFPHSDRRPRHTIDAYEFLTRTKTLKWFKGDSQVSYGMDQEDGEIPFFVMPILDISDDGVQMVYDMEVHVNHSFLSNGLCVHNCQQRQRRYKSAQEKTLEEMKIFDSTAITPGTVFMSKLSKYLNFYIRKMITTDPIWKKIRVIFSGPNVAGEGEHKIVQHIRDDPSRNELVHCMYGLDADLFMLGLGTHCPQFYLLREDQFNTKWDDTLFYIVDLGLLANEIFDFWGSVGGNKIRLIDDFLFVCFMVGNDFLHALPPCHDLVESINFVMDLRKETLESSYLTINETTFSLNNLAILLVELATTEVQTISEQFYKQNFPNITLNSSLIDPHYPDQGIDIKKYRELYYKKAGIDHTNKQQVWSFCKQYVQGLEWVHYYYHNWPKNWQWYFPYHYSPLTVDIVEYLTNASSGSRLTRVSNKESLPLLPFQQLLSVVPPKSKQLLPSYLQHAYNYTSLSKYYPDTFEIDLEGKIREWEAIALLPFIKIEDMIFAYRRAKKKAQENKILTKYSRNVPGKAIEFWYSQKKYTYKSDYGVIRNCNTGFKSN